MADDFGGRPLWAIQKEWSSAFLAEKLVSDKQARVAAWVQLWHQAQVIQGYSALLEYAGAEWSTQVYVFADDWGMLCSVGQRLGPEELLEWVTSEGLDAVYVFDRLNLWTLVVTHEDEQRYIWARTIVET